MKFGKAFSDSISVTVPSMFRKSRDIGSSWWLGTGRILVFSTILCIAVFVLIFRLVDLSLIRGHEFRMLADDNRTRELIRHAPRGILRDRTGKPLVENIPEYRLIEPCEVNPAQSCTVRISQSEGENLIKNGLSAGKFLEIDYVRQYRISEPIAHVIGYTGELSEKELKDEYYSLRKYKIGDRVGRYGAESVYEEKLRGRDGKELVEIDASGRIIRTLGRDMELPGQDVYLSLDAALSAVARDAFPVGKKGTVIVSKPSTGEILSMYSSPSFSPNLFSLGMSQSQYADLSNDAGMPLFNRAIGGVYPPGSTFKIVVALAALETQSITPDTVYEDTGVIKIGSFTFPNWYFLQYGKTDGLVNLVRAIAHSNDIFFYKAGEAMGITKLVTWAKGIGMGKPLGIELGGEASGLLPDPAWKKTQFTSKEDLSLRNDEWYTGDTYHVAIGQGYLLTTPIQVNAWTNVIANNGVLCRPTILHSIGGNSVLNKDCRTLSLKRDTISTITEGMRQACSDGGTGYPLFTFKVNSTYVPIACKTGTAEFGRVDASGKSETHAWFTAFAPIPESYAHGIGQAPLSENTITGEPEISVTVLVEDAGEGSEVAAPVAKKIFEAWFSR
ncbi:MAG: penicillin-binding transpeptidase domain-containing protein [Patescibacteria group bacterium]